MRKLAHEAEAMTGIRADQLLGRRRTNDVALVRQLFFYLLRESTTATWEAIGELFQRHHGTAMHGHSKVALMLRMESERRPPDKRPTALLVRKLAVACDLDVPRRCEEEKPGL